MVNEARLTLGLLCCFAQKRPDEDFSRMNQRGRERADGDEVDTSHPVPTIEEDDPKRLTVEVGQERPHESGDIARLSHLLVPFRRHRPLTDEGQPESRYSIGLARLDWFLLVVIVRR